MIKDCVSVPTIVSDKSHIKPFRKEKRITHPPFSKLWTLERMENGTLAEAKAVAKSWAHLRRAGEVTEGWLEKIRELPEEGKEQAMEEIRDRRLYI
jgi:hypothetical protein